MARRAPGSIRLFTAFGIDVFLHWSWFLVAVLWYQAVATSSGMFSEPWWHAILYVGLFAIVTMHEFGHALACRSVGGQADTIVLWPLGGIAFVQPPQRPGATLWSIAAGPMVNAILIVPLLLALMLVGLDTSGQSWAVRGDLGTFLLWLNQINLVLLIFNMLPVYPLDGGQVLQSILWFFLGRTRSLKVAASIGVGVAVLAVIPAFWLATQNGSWILFLVVLFIGWQAWNGLQYARQLARVGL